MVRREVVLDTETTGLDPGSGDHRHRIVEIAAVELKDRVLTGRKYHTKINPMRSVPEKVVKIHGLTEEHLRGYPIFEDIVGDFLDFIEDSPMIFHNAPFDMRFINAELSWAGIPPILNAKVIDTLQMARQKFPYQRVHLDALCKYYGIDTSMRKKHGALIDSKLLARVYVELLGEKQKKLYFRQSEEQVVKKEFNRMFVPSVPQEIEAHQNLVKTIKNALWTLKGEEQ